MFRRKPVWPEPEQSVGKRIGEVGGHTFWKTKGPARAAFDILKPKIRDKLNSCLVTQPQNWLTFSIYMIGNTPQTTTPFVMFISEQREDRKKAQHASKQLVTQHYAGIRMGNMATAPEFDILQQLGSRGFEDTGICSSSSGLSIQLRERRVTVKSIGDEAGYPREASVGGIVYNGSKRFILTAGHIFGPLIPDDPVPPYPRNEVNLDWGGDSEEDPSYNNDEEEEEEEEVEFMSRGSLSPKGTGSNASSRSGILFSRSPSPSESVAIMTEGSSIPNTMMMDYNVEDAAPQASQETGMNTMISPLSQPWPATQALQTSNNECALATAVSDLSEQESEQDIVFGQLVYCSLDLDCALIEVPATYEVPSDVLMPRVSHVVQEILEDSKVITQLASGHAIHGDLSGTTSLSRLPFGNTFQEIYTVQYEEFLHKGDCGSWVVDVSTGGLYGHIIAGSVRTGVGYLITAHAIFADITNTLDCQFSLRELPDIYGKNGHPLSTSEKSWWPLSERDTSHVSSPSEKSRVRSADINSFFRPR
jgi:hypothetical protein